MLVLRIALVSLYQLYALRYFLHGSLRIHPELSCTFAPNSLPGINGHCSQPISSSTFLYSLLGSPEEWLHAADCYM